MPEALFMVFRSDSKGAQVGIPNGKKPEKNTQKIPREKVCANLLGIMLLKEHLPPKIGFDTAENGLPKDTSPTNQNSRAIQDSSHC